MPTISVFFGISIYMYVYDHGEPHVHAVYAEWEASFSVETGRLDKGQFPRRASKLVTEWIDLHREELVANWERCQGGALPIWIEPLT